MLIKYFYAIRSLAISFVSVCLLFQFQPCFWLNYWVKYNQWGSNGSCQRYHLYLLIKSSVRHITYLLIKCCNGQESAPELLVGFLNIIDTYGPNIIQSFFVIHKSYSDFPLAIEPYLVGRAGYRHKIYIGPKPTICADRHRAVHRLHVVIGFQSKNCDFCLSVNWQTFFLHTS